MDSGSDTKVSQASVNLREATGLRQCGDCRMFISDGLCSHVQSAPRRIVHGTTCDDWSESGSIQG